MTGIEAILRAGLTLYSYVVILWVVFSWVQRPPDALIPLIRLVDGLVAPVVAPIRRVLPPVRIGAVALDLSALALLFGINILLRAL